MTPRAMRCSIENSLALIREETSDFNISCLPCSLAKLHLVFFWSIRMSVSPPRKVENGYIVFCAFSEGGEGTCLTSSCKLCDF